MGWTSMTADGTGLLVFIDVVTASRSVQGFTARG